MECGAAKKAGWASPFIAANTWRKAWRFVKPFIAIGGSNTHDEARRGKWDPVSLG